MKKIFLTLFLVAAGIASTQAQAYKTALGVRISSNDAAINHSITFKHFISGATAFEGMLSFGGPISLGALLEKHNSISSAAGLGWLYGAGAYVGFSGDRNVGAHAILGLDYKFAALPLNLSVDWKPELNIVRDFSFEPAAVGLSARFTLNQKNIE